MIKVFSSMLTNRSRLLLIFLVVISLLSSCAAPPVNAAATAPEPQQAATDKPLPPFGPKALGPLVSAKAPVSAIPLSPAVAAPQVAAPVETAPLIDTPVGPAFNWSTTDNYLILGTDRREGTNNWRTDSIMVVGLDRASNRAAVFSIPRDLYVNIPGYGMGRINQADFMGERNEPNGGGPKLVSKILEQNLGISTNHWVRIQMDGFIRFIDAMGGVTINLDCPFSEPIFNLTTNQWDNFVLPAGENKLDGQDAYWFARLRYRESDIGRSSRQRLLIWALRDQVLSTNALLRLPELWTAFQDTISTDLGLFDIIDLARLGLSLDAQNVRASGLTLHDLQNYTTEQGAAVLVIGNPARVRAIVEGVWDAPAMADAYRKDTARCPAAVQPAPPPADPTPTPEVTEGDQPAEGNPPAEGNQPTDESAAQQPTPEPESGG
jgi:LCP family protein required for cell wall assembly